MPGTPIEHLSYTIDEWNGPFRAFIDALEDIKVCYDIGANAGGFSRVILNKFPKAHIVAVEPIPDNFFFLKRELKGHTCLQRAIYYGMRETRMFWRGANIGAYFTEDVNAGDDKIFSGFTVPCGTLEELPEKPDLIKIDVEGAEENIIPNSKLLKETKYIILEWHPEHVPVIPFLTKHLPNHEIIINLENKQFLLCLR